MTEKYMFFNSTPDDRRRHQASDMAAYWSSFLSNGLIHKDGLPFLSLGLTSDKKGLYITPGTAIINGQLYINTDNLPMTLPSVSKETEFNVVLRWDNRIENRYIKMFVTEGALARNDNVYELLLYKVKKSATTTEINANDITDYRLDEQLCGIASSLVTVPTNVFRDDWEKLLGDYYKWLQSIQNESYATLGDVRVRDYALKRELSYMNLKLDAKDRIENGTTIGADFIREPLNMKFEDAKAEVDGNVSAGSSKVRYKNRTGDWSNVKSITAYSSGIFESLEVASYTSSELTLKTPVKSKITNGSMLIASAATQEDGGLIIGDVSTGGSIAIDSIDLGQTYDGGYLYDGYIYLIKGKVVYYYDINKKTRKTLYTAEGDLLYTQLKDVFTIVDSVGSTSSSENTIFFFVKDNQVFSETWKRDKIILTTPNDIRVNKLATVGAYRHMRFYEWDGKVVKQYGGYEVLGSYEVKYVSNFTGYELRFSQPQTTGLTINAIDTASNKVETAIAEGSYNYPRTKLFVLNQSPDHLLLVSEEKLILFYVTSGERSKVIETGVDASSVTVHDDGYYNYVYTSTGKHTIRNGEVGVNTTLNKTDIPLLFLQDKKKEKPFQLRGGRYLEGRFFEGEVIKPLVADVRIRVPQTKEVVIYAESTGGEIAGAWFGSIPATSKNSGNELQFVGYNETGSDQLRLRLSRKSTSDTIKVTRMLGGVLK